MSSIPSVPDTDAMQRFSATGRPYKPPTKADKFQGALSNIDVSDTFCGNVAPNLLPMRYTDDSLIPVPVLRPEDVAATRARRAESTGNNNLPSGGGGGVEEKPEKKKKFWQSRRASKDGGLNQNFVIKKIPRGVYLKHYAKDDDGQYCGTEEPAEDCLLRGQDLARYRGGLGQDFDDGMSVASTLVPGGNGDGVIR